MELSLHMTDKRNNSLKNILEKENLSDYLNNISRTIVDWKEAERLYDFIVYVDMERDNNLEIARISRTNFLMITDYFWDISDIQSFEKLKIVDKLFDWENKDMIIMWGV